MILMSSPVSPAARSRAEIVSPPLQRLIREAVHVFLGDGLADIVHQQLLLPLQLLF